MGFGNRFEDATGGGWVKKTALVIGAVLVLAVLAPVEIGRAHV